jgi:hypothetical protein
MIGKTAAYTILKNEIKYIEKWLYYTKDFDYRVLLDTGSTDGSWKLLQDAASKDANLIIEQKTWDKWDFSVARNYNLDMIPQDVDWCLSPDLDEYFSINVLDDMEIMLQHRPDVTNMSTTRLDLYTKEVFVGPPNQLPSNKIHKRHLYYWNSPIYEHLLHKEPEKEIELHLPNVYLIHDQDFKKTERSPLYLKMLIDEYITNPTNLWTLWFLVNHYFTKQDLDNFIMTGCDFIRYHSTFDSKYKEVLGALTHMYKSGELTDDQKINIGKVITGRSI